MLKEILAGALVVSLTSCRAPEPTPILEKPDPEITTECRGKLKVSRMLGEMRSIGKQDAVIEPFLPERPLSEDDVKYIKTSFDKASCAIPNINHPNLATNTVVICGRELTLPMLKRELITAGYPEAGPWDGRSTIKAFRDAGCPEENILSATPTPQATPFRKA